MYTPDLRGKIFCSNYNTQEKIVIVGTSPDKDHYQIYKYKDRRMCGALEEIPVLDLFDNYTAIKPSHVISYHITKLSSLNENINADNIIVMINPYDGIPNNTMEFPVMVVNLLKAIQYLVLENSDIIAHTENISSIHDLKPLPAYAINEIARVVNVPTTQFGESDHPVYIPGLINYHLNNGNKSYAYLFEPTGINSPIYDILVKRLEKGYLLKLNISGKFLDIMDHCKEDILTLLGLEPCIYSYLNVYDIQGALTNFNNDIFMNALGINQKDVSSLKAFKKKFLTEQEVLTPQGYSLLNSIHNIKYPGANPIIPNTVKFKVLNHFNWDQPSNNYRIKIYFKSTDEILLVEYSTLGYIMTALSPAELQTFLKSKK